MGKKPVDWDAYHAKIERQVASFVDLMDKDALSTLLKVASESENIKQWELDNPGDMDGLIKRMAKSAALESIFQPAARPGTIR